MRVADLGLLGVVVVLLLVCPDAQAQDCGVEVTYQNLSYPRAYASLRSVDFRNFTFYEFDEKGRPTDPLKLVAGKYEKEYELGWDWTGLGRVRYLRSTPAGPQWAIVDFNVVNAGGSSTSIGVIQLFELVSGKLVVRQQITYGGKGDAGFSYDSKRKLLTVRSTFCADPDMKVKYLVDTFRWNGRRFERITSRKIPWPPNESPY